jgi:SAM-dependent methyltransferase
MRASDPEVSDLIVDVDPATLARRAVSKRDLMTRFASLGNQQAARVVEEIPARDGFLDEQAVDALLVRTHTEMQRMAEEFQHGHRLLEILAPMLRVLRKHCGPPYRVVDIGCGIGFTTRWLTANSKLGDEVQFIGADLNPALIAEAKRLAALENLNCEFVLADAFRLPSPGNVFTTTGVIHHFRGDGLRAFLAHHEQPHTQAFFHYDFQPSPLAPIGSWFWHRIRMRTALARHDGVLSAVRAYSANELVDAARPAAPGFLSGMYGRKIWRTPLPRIFHTLVGIRPALRDDFLRELGIRAGRMGELR